MDGESRWSPPALLAASTLSVVFYLARERLRDGLWILDMVNLAFHEAGHPIFGVLGLGVHWIAVAGGTLMQLLLPAAAAGHFFARGEHSSGCVCLAWVGQNLLGIGVYMADARAQVLPLLGAGEHDWTYLFESLHLLIYDVRIGGLTQLAGCLVMAFSLTGAYVYRSRPEATSD